MVSLCVNLPARVSLLLLLLCAISGRAEDTGSSAIVQLTDDNFDKVVKKAELILVEFHVEWCVYCRKLSPHLEEAATQLAPHGVLIGKCDIEVAKKMKARFELQELPDLRLFWKGEMFKYGGPRDDLVASNLVNYLLNVKNSPIPDNPVLVLNKDNFDRIVNSAELILVDFFLKECMPCMQLEPHYSAAARRLQQLDLPVKLGKLDIPSNMDIAQRFPMTDFPLLKMFRMGKEYNYTGPRHEDGIVTYMQKQAGPSSTFLSSKEAVKEFYSSPDEARAVAFFSAETDPALIEAYSESGNLVRLDLKLGHTTDAKIAASLSFPLETVVVFHPRNVVTKFEEGYSIIKDLEVDSKKLSQRYLDALRPLVGQMTKTNMLRAYRHRPLLIAYYEVSWDKEHLQATQYWHSLVASVAIQYTNTDLAFAIGDDKEFDKDLKALGFSEWGEDVAVGIFAPGPRKYRLLEEVTKESLKNFVDAFLNNELKPYYSSQAPPKENKGPVKTIVGETFKKVVYNRKKNVIVMLCIPQLPDCKKASKWFLDLANRFYKKTNDMVFAEMDVELNDAPVEGLNIDKLPAVIFSGADYKEEELAVITPTPIDDIDVLVWLRRNANIRPPKDAKKKKKKAKDEL